MGTGDECRKRPCRICRQWFMPNPRLKDSQKTCGDPACQRKWHKYIAARDGLLKKDLIAFDGSIYQVLALLQKPVLETTSQSFTPSFKRTRNSGIGRLIQKSLWEV